MIYDTSICNSKYLEYKMFCRKEKAIYAILNMFEGEGALLRCDVWYPLREEDDIRRLLISQSTREEPSAMLVTGENERSI
jgi:V-type H+-transporting ATPase subunit a